MSGVSSATVLLADIAPHFALTGALLDSFSMDFRAGPQLPVGFREGGDEHFRDSVVTESFCHASAAGALEALHKKGAWILDRKKIGTALLGQEEARGLVGPNDGLQRPLVGTFSRSWLVQEPVQGSMRFAQSIVPTRLTNKAVAYADSFFLPGGVRSVVIAQTGGRGSGFKIDRIEDTYVDQWNRETRITQKPKSDKLVSSAMVSGVDFFSLISSIVSPSGDLRLKGLEGREHWQALTQAALLFSAELLVAQGGGGTIKISSSASGGDRPELVLIRLENGKFRVKGVEGDAYTIDDVMGELTSWWAVNDYYPNKLQVTIRPRGTPQTMRIRYNAPIQKDLSNSYDVCFEHRRPLFLDGAEMPDLVFNLLRGVQELIWVRNEQAEEVYAGLMIPRN